MCEPFCNDQLLHLSGKSKRSRDLQKNFNLRLSRDQCSSEQTGKTYKRNAVNNVQIAYPAKLATTKLDWLPKRLSVEKSLFTLVLKSVPIIRTSIGQPADWRPVRPCAKKLQATEQIGVDTADRRHSTRARDYSMQQTKKVMNHQGSLAVLRTWTNCNWPTDCLRAQIGAENVLRWVNLSISCCYAFAWCNGDCEVWTHVSIGCSFRFR